MPDNDVRRPSPGEAEQAVVTLLRYIGEDPSRPGLLDTPKRVLRAWAESWGAGYKAEPLALAKLFPHESPWPTNGRGMVVVEDIDFYSTCEHHMAPFYGKATIGYLPGTQGLLGLSKAVRIVNYFARRLQVQERLTDQIADYLEGMVSADCGVIMRASHMCMVSRGVQQPQATTVTSSLRGVIFNDERCRSEFLALARAPR